jgi:hypothetical protein
MPRFEDAFDFTAEDLAHNRKGVISPVQYGSLEQTRRFLLVMLGLPIAPALIFGVVAPGLFAGDDATLRTVLLGIAATILLGSLPFLWSLFQSWRALGGDLYHNQVEMLQGIPDLTPPDAPRHLRLGDHQFDLRESQGPCFVTGRAYTLYILPRYQHILSVDEGERNGYNSA